VKSQKNSKAVEKHITIEFVHDCINFIHPKVMLCTKVVISINFYVRLPYCFVPVVNVTNLLMHINIVVCKKSICTPRDKTVNTIRTSSSHNHCRYATVAETKQRVFLHSKIL